jgi:hypothetical protein
VRTQQFCVCKQRMENMAATKNQTKEQTKEQKDSTDEKKRELSLGVAIRRLRRALYDCTDVYIREKKLSGEQASQRVRDAVEKAFASRAEHESMRAELAALRAKYGDKFRIVPKTGE